MRPVSARLQLSRARERQRTVLGDALVPRAAHSAPPTNLDKQDYITSSFFTHKGHF